MPEPTPPAPDLDPRIPIAIDAKAWGDAADRVEDFYVISPSAGAWVIQYTPVLRTAAEGKIEDAAYLLHPGIWENKAPRDVHERLVFALARALEEKHGWVAAELYATLKSDPKMAERAQNVARKLQGKVEDVPAKFAEALALRAQARLATDPNDRGALEGLAWATVSSDPDNAFSTAERAVQADPTLKRAWFVLAEIARKAGRTEKAVDIVFAKAAQQNPGAAWPCLAQARLIAETDFNKALDLSDRALQADPQDFEACELRRRMLRKLEKWAELAEQLQYMVGLTVDRKKLSELYDEWARTTSDPLRDAIGAVELQKQADFFRDEKQVADFYWKNLQENEKDKRVWDEVDDFFRQNRMWTDLGRLLAMRLERAMPDDRLVLIDQLRIVWAMVPGRGDVAWADVVESEIERAGKDEELKKQLEERLSGVDLPAPEKEKVDVGYYVMIAAGVLVIIILIVAVVALLPFFVS